MDHGDAAPEVTSSHVGGGTEPQGALVMEK